MGDAVTVAPVVALSPVEGDHEYVVAPLAVSVVEPPEQIAADAGETLTFGEGVTVTVTDEVLLHPEAVPVTV